MKYEIHHVITHGNNQDHKDALITATGNNYLFPILLSMYEKKFLSVSINKRAIQGFH